MKGEREFVSGRAWGDKGSGRYVDKPKSYWLPGSVLLQDHSLPGRSLRLLGEPKLR